MSAARRNAPVFLLGVAIAVNAVVLTVAQWDVTYFQDTFGFLLDRQEFSADAFFTPHNEHIVVIPVAITKLLLEIFGMTSNTPEQVAMALTIFAVAILAFVYVRRRTEAWLGLIAAVMILFLGAAWPTLIWPFQNEFTLPVAFGIGSLLMLDRDDRRGDAWACLLIVLAVISGTLGVCFGVAAFVNVLQRYKERGWARIYIVVIPALVFVAWYLGWGHEAESQITLDNILASPRYVMEGFASAICALVGLNTVTVTSPGPNDWGPPLLIAAIGLAAFGQWRKPGFSPGFWPVTAAAVTYWTMAAFNSMPGREASASRYIYTGAVLLVLMAAELLRDRPLSRRALLAVGVVTLLAIPPSMAKMKEGSTWMRDQSVLTRADLGAMEIARDTMDPEFSLISMEISGTSSLGSVWAEKYLRAVDRWGGIGYSPEELVDAPENGRRYADIVLGQALPVSTVTELETFAEVGEPDCITLQPGQAAGTETRVEPGVTRIEVAPGPRADFSLRRFMTGEYPVQTEGADGGTTTLLRIPPDRATQPWYLQVTASQLVRICP